MYILFNWTAGNIMLQESPDGIIKTRILDFGSATPLYSKDGWRGFRTDMAEVVRKFTALNVGQHFDSERDIRENWEVKIGEVNILATRAIFFYAVTFYSFKYH